MAASLLAGPDQTLIMEDAIIGDFLPQEFTLFLFSRVTLTIAITITALYMYCYAVNLFMSIHCYVLFSEQAVMSKCYMAMLYCGAILYLP